MQATAERIAYAQAETISFATPDGAAILETPRGVAEVLYQSLRTRYPKLTRNFVAESVDALGLVEIQNQIDAVNGLGPLEPPSQT